MIGVIGLGADGFAGLELGDLDDLVQHQPRRAGVAAFVLPGLDLFDHRYSVVGVAVGDLASHDLLVRAVTAGFRELAYCPTLGGREDE